MARPRTGRTIKHTVRLSKDEEKLIAEAAQARAMTISSFLRLSAIGSGFIKDPPKISMEAAKEIWRQVAGMGRNMNQLTHSAHINKELYRDELERLENEYQSLRILIEDLIR